MGWTKIRLRTIAAVSLGVAFFLFQAAALSAETIREAVTRSLANSDARNVAITSIRAQNKTLAITQAQREVTVDL